MNFRFRIESIFEQIKLTGKYLLSLSLRRFIAATMLIEASKGGHIGVVQLLLDYPNWMYQQQQPPQEVKLQSNHYLELNAANHISPTHFENPYLSPFNQLLRSLDIHLCTVHADNNMAVENFY